MSCNHIPTSLQHIDIRLVQHKYHHFRMCNNLLFLALRKHYNLGQNSPECTLALSNQSLTSLSDLAQPPCGHARGLTSVVCIDTHPLLCIHHSRSRQFYLSLARVGTKAWRNRNHHIHLCMNMCQVICSYLDCSIRISPPLAPLSQLSSHYPLHFVGSCCNLSSCVVQVLSQSQLLYLAHSEDLRRQYSLLVPIAKYCKETCLMFEFYL